MRNKYIRYSALIPLLLVGTLLSTTSCSNTWSWLWSREENVTVDTGDMIYGGGASDGEDNIPTEGAVDYTGEAHAGTDIYYIGKEGSPNRSRIIVIDAGHQLKGSAALEPNGPSSEIMKAEVTWGATGVYTGQTEYELNLAVALLLRDELIRRGYSVVMIRETNNVRISNMERAQIANKYEAAAYIRIHANSWTDESMRGAMTISQSASNPYPTCAIHYGRSRQLSLFVLDRFCEETGIQRLNPREMDDMTGTNWSEVPTTIVEMGFLSNKSDDTLMATDYFRREAALGIANGLEDYFEWLETQLPEWETRPQKPAETTAEEPTDESTVEPTDEPAEDTANAEPEDGNSEVTDGSAVTEFTTTESTVTEPIPDTPEEPDTPPETEITPDGDGTDDGPSEEPPIEEALSDEPALNP